MKRWKIVDEGEAQKLHIKVVEGYLIIDLSAIPEGVSVAEYEEIIQKEDIVLRVNNEDGVEFNKSERL